MYAARRSMGNDESCCASAEDLIDAIENSFPFLKKITEKQASQKRADGGWSPKEIIGHLVDSACNNHQKWVRAAQFPGSKFPGYDADFWVEMSDYRSIDWLDLLAFWEKYQRHLAHFIAQVPEAYWSNQIEIVANGRATLAFMMADYVVHFNHHLSEILP